MTRLRKGFTLLEAVVTVAVVSVTSLFVLRAFGLAMATMRVSQDMTRACLVAEEKMWDLQGQLAGGAKMTPGQEKRTSGGMDFTCAWTVETLKDIKLSEAHLTVSWKEGRRGGERSIALAYVLGAEAP
jgi:prepilin-type N-terminal cleavage/methylation domain-containing protein